MTPIHFDMSQARNEGWEIKPAPDGHPMIVAYPEGNTSDTVAVEYVLRRATGGHDYHAKALKIVMLKAAFLDRPAFTISTDYGTMIVDFENGAVIEAPTEDKGITMIDVEEWLNVVGSGRFTPGSSFNLSMLGYWRDEGYVDPQDHRLSYMLNNGGSGANWLSKAIQASLKPTGQYIMTYTIIVEANHPDTATEIVQEALSGAVAAQPTFSRFTAPAPVLIEAQRGASPSAVRSTLFQSAPALIAEARRGSIL